MTESVRDRFSRVQLAHSRMQGKREAFAQRATALTSQVALAKGRLALGDEVTHVLDVLQERAHHRSVGLFEKLLSAILQDVLPEKGDVQLVLGTERGMPALDILIDNDGQQEDILDGNGGAVTNVVTAGLRFAALSRTQNRKLMVLDEPDCWLKPTRVPAFIKVIAEIADQANTQTLLISHHDPAYFEARVNVVRLVAAEEGGVHAEIIEPRVTAWADEAQPGIRGIRLINFRAHKDTTIPFFPGVTALIGDNDLGKSTALVSALKAVAYGESDDRVFRHGETEAKVIIYLENNRRLEWTRKLKGSPKVMYALYEGEAETPSLEGRQTSRGEAPEWVRSELGINPVDDFDIQIGRQKQPIFLLNETPSRRAQLLSVGRESGHLHMLRGKYNEVTKKDRETSREGEAELTKLTYQLERLTRLDEVGGSLKELNQKLVSVEEIGRRALQAQALVARLEKLQELKAQQEAELEVLKQLPPAAPQLSDTRQLAKMIEGMQACAKIAQIRPNWLAVELPVLQPLDGLVAMGKRLAQGTQRVARLEGVARIALPAMPTLLTTATLEVSLRRVTETANRAQQQQQAAAQADRDVSACEQDIEDLKELLDGVCPLCQGLLPEKGIAHAH